jgi:tellurite resistance protein TerC
MGTLLLWFSFNVFVLLAITLDLGVFHRRAHKIAWKEAALWSAIWIALATLFGLGIWHWYGPQRGLEYFTGYVIEKALSIDNLFVFLVIFRAYRVDERVQHRVLQWGIIGALLMRGLMIAAGAELIKRFHWLLPALGVFLVYAGVQMLLQDQEKKGHYENNPIFRFARGHLRVTRAYQDERFFTREDGLLFATPLFLVLLIVEISDVIFAIDSIPAIFGITRDAFIVYTSNVFAILGLRAMYFLLSDTLDYFRYLDIGLGAVLIFLGAKMAADPWWRVSVPISLAVVGAILILTMMISWAAGRNNHERGPRKTAG